MPLFDNDLVSNSYIKQTFHLLYPRSFLCSVWTDPGLIFYFIYNFVFCQYTPSIPSSVLFEQILLSFSPLIYDLCFDPTAVIWLNRSGFSSIQSIWFNLDRVLFCSITRIYISTHIRFVFWPYRCDLVEQIWVQFNPIHLLQPWSCCVLFNRPNIHTDVLVSASRPEWSTESV